MKTILIFLFSFTLILSTRAQDSKEIAGLKKGEIKLVGVWKMDLSDQKKNLESNEKSNLEILDEASQKKFWERTESWVYALDEDMNFVVTWVENSSLQELRGKWTFDSEKNLLELKTQQEIFEYQVTFYEKKQVWKPTNKSKEDFKSIHVKRLGL